jgi:glutathione peroxidase
MRNMLLAVLTVAFLAMGITTGKAGPAHEFGFTSIEGDPLPMSRFAGKTVLLVNTASHCGYTYQYDGLQALYDQYKDQGLVVLGLPSNDFGGQEPGSEKEIKEFCEVNFSINFPMTEKQVVKGEQAHPIYGWIGSELGRNKLPRWNFYKYLINAKGEVIASWSNRVKPMSGDIRKAVEKELNG